ncbi:MAG TPA: nicotinate phosphoribosyltransferase [Kofleriaceae bacterium]|nr:nicotinate phosphoribosyltransferase [Kofleriaceae bacterium]
MTPPPRPLGLYTDLYELRMLESYLRLGMTGPATFSLYARASRARPVLVSAGLDVALDVLDGFRFGGEEIAYLRAQGISPAALDWLSSLRPSGELVAVPDGTVVLAEEPLLELTAPLPVAQLLETALTNAIHGATLVATKAARLVRAARGRPVIDFGFRRAHGLETGVRAAVSAFVGGAAATSNVEAGRRFGIPISGTMAHAFVQAFDREIDALREFAADHADTTLLVDTYDTLEGVAAAIQVAEELAGRGQRVGGIRIDSGALGELAAAARDMLDRAGLRGVQLVASGGLDEGSIDELVRAGAPYDAFGVGSSLVVSSDRPALDMAYKLVDYAGVGRAKYSPGKHTWPGAKQVYRRGAPDSDVLELQGAPAPDGAPLLAPAWRDGERLYRFDPEEARTRAQAALAPLPDAWLLPPGPDEPPAPKIGPALAAEAEATRRRFGR